jgi:hypothetical protein
MDCIEHIIFTSSDNDIADRCRVLAASPGIGQADLQELAAWGPSPGSLLESADGRASMNFHPLPSGAFCVSRSTPAGGECGGGEFGGRADRRVQTHSLVVPPTVLAQAANNPMALWRAAAASESSAAQGNTSHSLNAIRLPECTAAADADVLAQLCVSLGADWMATLVQAALDAVTLAIVGGPPAEQVVEGLLQCLPPACRTEFSFSTGLAFSSRRPFRVVVFPADSVERQRVERLYNVAVLAISGTPAAEFAPIESWPRFIQRAMRSGQFTFLANCLARQSTALSLADLPALGLEMLEQLDALPGGQTFLSASPDDPPILSASTADTSRSESQGDPLNTPPVRRQRDAQRWSVAHGPERRSAASPPEERANPKADAVLPVEQVRPASCRREPRESLPSEHLDLGNHQLLEKLERLDDAVFDAIAGDDAALEKLKQIWPQLCAELSQPLLAESQEHYLRRAVTAWERGAKGDAPRSPQAAVQLLDVLATLFG